MLISEFCKQYKVQQQHFTANSGNKWIDFLPILYVHVVI